ncbi:MAG TPA: hypothetical protein VGJ18_18620 [Gemmatimonadaceae bacterium]|jgi:hypothetical protein
MTLLQRTVVQRLRDRGYGTLANAAKDCWSNGERVMVNALLVISPDDAQLRIDYERCDEQAAAGRKIRAFS